MEVEAVAFRQSQPAASTHDNGRRERNPTEADHPDHAEAVEIVFDPDRTTYRGMLEVWGRCLGG